MKVETTSNTITFTFDGLAPIVFDAALADVHHAQQAKMHGYEQKIRDSAAIARKQADGSIITVTEEMRRNAVENMVTHLTTCPDWNQKKASIVKQSPVIAAIAAKLGITYEQAEAKVAEKMLEELSA